MGKVARKWVSREDELEVRCRGQNEVKQVKWDKVDADENIEKRGRREARVRTEYEHGETGEKLLRKDSSGETKHKTGEEVN